MSVLEYDDKDDDEDEEESEDDGETFADISDWTEKASNKSSEKIGLEKNCPSIRQEADNAEIESWSRKETNQKSLLLLHIKILVRIYPEIFVVIMWHWHILRNKYIGISWETSTSENKKHNAAEQEKIWSCNDASILLLLRFLQWPFNFGSGLFFLQVCHSYMPSFGEKD